MLTVAVAHVFRNTYSCYLHDLYHVRLFTPDLRGRQPLKDARLAECSPAALRLRQVLEKPYDAMLHLDISIGLQQGSKIGGE